jgi:enoyl-CoA hydratase
MATAKEAAAKICAKRPRVLRAAKEALNHIDIYHLQKHYRLEQGYTYELNLYGDGGAGTRIANILASAPLRVQKRLSY